MLTIKNLLPLIFGEVFWKKMVAYTILLSIGYTLGDFLILFFVTFLFAYIFLELGTWLSHKIHDWGEKGKGDTAHMIAAKYSTANIVISVLYIIFIAIIIFIFINIIPQIGNEIQKFLGESPKIARQVQEFVVKIETKANLKLGLDQIVGDYLNGETLKNIGETAFSYVKDAGVIMVKFLIALILSYMFIIERTRIDAFLMQIRRGNFRFLYDEWAIIAKKVGTGFGMIFQAQSLIALVNAILTTIGLIIISLIHGGGPFPFIFTLTLIVFISGFIPVFGVFLSSIPILILGYGYGGLPVVMGVVAMVGFVHAVEAYYLNPKIVSSYVHFPVFITFVILLISEHIFGLIGLLIGIPLTYILIGLIDDFDIYVDSIKKKIKSIS